MSSHSLKSHARIKISCKMSQGLKMTRCFYWLPIKNICHKGTEDMSQVHLDLKAVFKTGLSQWEWNYFKRNFILSSRLFTSNERNKHVLKFFAYIHFTDHQRDQIESAKGTSSQNELSSSGKDAPDAKIGMEFSFMYLTLCNHDSVIKKEWGKHCSLVV